MLAVLLLALAVAPPQPDVQQIIHKALALWEAEASRLAPYIYMERDETRELDDNNKVKSVTSKTHEIRMIEGSPYRRLVERDSKPVPQAEEELQAAYLKDNIARRANETPGERARRIADYEKRRDRYLATIREIPRAFDFTLVGEETIAGRRTWVVDATPRRGYEPKDRFSHMYPRLRSRLWFDTLEYQLVKLTAESTDTISFGWILIRIAKGGRAEVERTRLADGTWAMTRLWYHVAARVGLFRLYHREDETTHFGFRKLPQM